MNKENQIKNESGKQAKILVSEMLNNLKNELGINIEIEEGYSIGYPNQEKQFKMDFLVQFTDFDNEQWLIKSTNSIRERIYGTEFFAQNIRLIDEKVKNIYVVVPDSISSAEMKKKRNYSVKINGTTYTSFLTDVLTVNELRQKIVEKASQNIAQGLRANVLGNDAETSIVNLLNDLKNKALWNDYQNAQQTIKSSTYKIYKEILEKIDLKEGFDKILEVTATNDIPLLSNRGKPKTDVSVTIKTNTKELIRNISIKNTREKTVTIHEGSVSDLISALKLSESDPLSQALIHFEKVGSKKKLIAEHPNSDKILEENLKLYNRELIEFFIFGLHSPLVNDKIQMVDLIIFTNKFAVWNRDDYIKHYIEEYSGKGQFGTPFKWTYPSKKRGQKIQIKGFSNN
ncbi:MspI family type II restriction endonuclease [Bacillus subtilis]|uniref:MspI family type II restriction endonuclease n=1 Tax=Bacillus subtilis TaxID=1423 RepID=UPI000B4AD706|nr:MspI family type II restriction endonuclease [Bacillus subtilis]ASB68679.1 Type-2 restriction enzyme BsuFI [Bacillus subtilis subsp. subtilis]AYK66649.1 type II restriction endonuclease [Bacillus subtilis subsp. subtilis]MEC0417339.1 MspI family type II restriction endonuclease [Bacillus subtilis]